jgi:hypothetical protein
LNKGNAISSGYIAASIVKRTMSEWQIATAAAMVAFENPIKAETMTDDQRLV